jgi:hypothetical protein
VRSRDVWLWSVNCRQIARHADIDHATAYRLRFRWRPSGAIDGNAASRSPGGRR